MGTAAVTVSLEGEHSHSKSHRFTCSRLVSRCVGLPFATPEHATVPVFSCVACPAKGSRMCFTCLCPSCICGHAVACVTAHCLIALNCSQSFHNARASLPHRPACCVSVICVRLYFVCFHLRLGMYMCTLTLSAPQQLFFHS